jgi:hypothetical protein
LPQTTGDIHPTELKPGRSANMRDDTADSADGVLRQALSTLSASSNTIDLLSQAEADTPPTSDGVLRPRVPGWHLFSRQSHAPRAIGTSNWPVIGPAASGAPITVRDPFALTGHRRDPIPTLGAPAWKGATVSATTSVGSVS